MKAREAREKVKNNKLNKHNELEKIAIATDVCSDIKK